MKTNPGQLSQLLKKGLSPVYLVSGDEPLLVQECCDQVRKAAKDAGYHDRLTFHADHQLDWNAVGDALHDGIEEWERVYLPSWGSDDRRRASAGRERRPART